MKVKELMARYKLKTRQSLYDRLNKLEIKLNKDASNRNYATQDQIDRLDDLDKHLKNGGTLRTYTPPSDTVVDTVIDNKKDSVTNNQITVSSSLDKLIDTILARVIPNDPIKHHELLEKAYQNGWELKTSEIKQLIGSKPRNTHYHWGCWLFEKMPYRIGRESGWRVFKKEV